MELKANKLKFTDNQTSTYKIDYVYDDQSGFNFMFNSKDNKVFGLVTRVDSFQFDKTKLYDLTSTETYMTYKVYLVHQGKMYKGCGRIEIDS